MEIMYEVINVNINLVMETYQPIDPFHNSSNDSKPDMFAGGGCCLFGGTSASFIRNDCKNTNMFDQER
jgi:hypothetical protein